MLKLIEWARRFFPGHPVPETITLEELFAEFEAQGIRALLNFAHAIFPDETDALNLFNYELAERYPQILPVGTLHPDSPEPLRVVSQCLEEYGFLGLKFHAFVQKFLPWEPRMRPVYEAVAARGRILYFHTGFETFYGGQLPVAGWAELLEAIPPTPIVFAHACFPHFEAAFELLDRHPHLYLDIVNTLSPLAAMWLDGQDLEDRHRVLRQGIEACSGATIQPGWAAWPKSTGTSTTSACPTARGPRFWPGRRDGSSSRWLRVGSAGSD